MTAPHYVVFVGASASLSTELGTLAKRFEEVKVLAPAMPKLHRGLSDASTKAALDCLFREMAKDESQAEPARLTIWSYEPTTTNQLDTLWSTFGRSAWVEMVPADLINKDNKTREYISKRINAITPLIHEISSAVYCRRKSSPVPLPISNFHSTITENLKLFWYRKLDLQALVKKIKSLNERYQQSRVREEGAYKDDRHLIFSPAHDSECHGKPHPTGPHALSFICGRFRFGASLYAGFHYDVKSAKTTTIESILEDGAGKKRNMRPEKREYINIFPNDHLLPE